MYEYLVENLVNSNQVQANLRRTIDKGLVSYLNRLQLIKLALKYFGVDKDGNYTSNPNEIVDYRCPYSGELGIENLHLDHIIPVNLKGGTILFNCIPISSKSNRSKWDMHLLKWWPNKSYFDYDRLERLIQYMLEAYDIYGKEIDEDDLYDDSSAEASMIEEDDDLSEPIQRKTINENQVDLTINESVFYFQFLSSLIDKLSNYTNVEVYQEKLSKLKEKDVFGEIKDYDEIIKIVQRIIKEKIGNDNTSFLTYSLNINIQRLYNSLKTNNYETRNSR